MSQPRPNDPCQDLFFEATAPGSESDRAARAEHLADCPLCASQAGRDAALTRAWEDSRPVEPGAETWDAVWCCVSGRLDHAGVPGTAPLMLTTAPAPWRRHAMSAFVVAQAAAILGVVVFWGSHRGPAGPLAPPALYPAIAARSPVLGVDIEPGEVVMIHLDGETFRPVTMAHEDQRPDTLDENLILFNDAEAMAGMRETIAEMHHYGHPQPPG